MHTSKDVRERSKTCYSKGCMNYKSVKNTSLAAIAPLLQKNKIKHYYYLRQTVYFTFLINHI